MIFTVPSPPPLSRPPPLSLRSSSRARSTMTTEEVAVDVPPAPTAVDTPTAAATSDGASTSTPATAAAPTTTAASTGKKDKTPEEQLAEKQAAIKALLGSERVLDVPPVEGSIVARVWRLGKMNFLLMFFGTVWVSLRGRQLRRAHHYPPRVSCVR